jgi:hypothetical protein
MNIALHPIEALGKVYDAYIEAVSFPENIPRIREYKLIFNKYSKLIEEAKAQGDFKKVKELETARQVDATNAANEVTLNFKKAGIYAATINQFAFGFNPAVRGLSKMSSLLKNSPARTITRGIVSLTLPTIALYFMQKDEDWYKNLPEWEKEGFFHFKIGEKIIRLPRPFEWGWAFSNIPEAIMNSYNEDDLSKMKEVLTSGQNVLPNVPIPDLVKPSLEAYFNWDLFKSRAITPRSEVDLLPELQYGRNTSPNAKKLGEILGVSPRNIDHVLSGYTGGMASDILTALPKEYKESADIPVIGRLFVRKSSYVESGQYTQDFYSDYDRARKIKISQNKIKSGAKDGEISLSKEDEFILKDKKEIDRNAKQLKFLRDKYVQVEGSNLEKELKEKSLDAIAYAQYLVVKDYIEAKHNYLKGR